MTDPRFPTAPGHTSVYALCMISVTNRLAKRVFLTRLIAVDYFLLCNLIAKRGFREKANMHLRIYFKSTLDKGSKLIGTVNGQCNMHDQRDK